MRLSAWPTVSPRLRRCTSGGMLVERAEGYELVDLAARLGQATQH